MIHNDCDVSLQAAHETSLNPSFCGEVKWNWFYVELMMKMKHALSKTFSSKNFPGWPKKSSGISIYPEIVFLV